ncbi:MAG: hypothetical protein ACOYWZ_00145 [Bacillota bacterium]
MNREKKTQYWLHKINPEDECGKTGYRIEEEEYPTLSDAVTSFIEVGGEIIANFSDVTSNDLIELKNVNVDVDGDRRTVTFRK